MKEIIIKHKNKLIAIIINLLFVSIVLCFYGLFYGQSDDQFFSQNIVKGNYNYTFCSFFIQFLSVLLQKVIYPYNAFLFLQLFLNFLSLTAICYVFLSVFGIKKGIVFSVIIESVFSLNFYAHVTFTQTATVLLVAGTLLMMWANQNHRSIVYQFVGILFIVFGSFYRFDIFYSVMAVFAVFVLSYLLSKIRQDNSWNIVNLLKQTFTVKNILVVLVMITSVFSLQFFSTKIIDSYDGMDYYREYTKIRAKVVDYDIPLYESCPDEYNSIGMSENDFQMLRSWLFDDEGYTSIETLEQVVQLQEDHYPGVVNALKNMAVVELRQILSFSPEGILLISYAILAIGVLSFYRKKSWIFVGSLSMIMLSLYSYLWISGRCNHRAVLSFIFASFIYLLYVTQFLQKRKFICSIPYKHNKLIKCIAMLLCIVFALSTLSLSFVQYYKEFNNKSIEKYSDLQEYILNSDDKSFALLGEVYMRIRKATIFDTPYLADHEIFEKCVYYGSAYYAHPSYNEMLNDIGVNNLYTDIIDNDDIYVVDIDKVDIFIEYLNEQYGKDHTYGYELITSIDGFMIYKIKTIS